MERRIVLWIFIALLFLAVLAVMFKTGSTGNAVAAVQSTGAVVQGAAAPAMVGGC